MSTRRIALSFLGSALLCGCGLLHKVVPFRKENPPDTAKVNPTRRGWGLMMTDQQLAELGYGDAAAGPNATNPAPQSSDGAGGGGGLFDFSSMIPKQPEASSRITWQRSATEAMRQSRLTGRPLLIYLTHQSSVPAQQMENTLMVDPAFTTLVQERCTALRVDFADRDTARSELYRGLKKRFHVSGYPTLILTLPDGTEVARLTGYKPEYQKRNLDTLRSGVERAGTLAAERRAKLEKEEGYRLWTRKDGQPVFAKLTALDANMGAFTGEWGENFKTFLTRLSAEDQAWIAERRQDP